MIERPRCIRRAVRWALLCLSAALGVPGAPAVAADFPLILRRIDQAAIAESRRSPDEVGIRAAGPKPPEKTFTLGLAHENDQGGGHGLTTPFVFDEKTGSWDFQLGGDGYTRGASGTDRVSGVGDIATLAQYALTLDAPWVLVPGLGLTIPVGGQAGSKHLGEVAQLIVVATPLGPWTLSGGGIVARSGGTPAGVSAYAKTGIAKAHYGFDRTTAASVLFKRTYRSGSGGASALALVYDFQVGQRPLSIAAVQGLSGGKRNTVFEFDVTF